MAKKEQKVERVLRVPPAEKVRVEEKPGASWYLVKNSSMGPRVVYNSAVKPVTIPPREQRKIKLDPGTAGRIETYNSGITVTPVAAEAEVEASLDAPKRQAPAKAKKQRASVQEKAEVVKEPRSAADLLTALDDPSADYPTLMAEAKGRIGEEDWPGGVPNKGALKSLLRKRAIADSKA